MIVDKDFFEAPAILITLIVVGRWLEAISKGKASESVRKLASMQASSAIWIPKWSARAEESLQPLPADAAGAQALGAQTTAQGENVQRNIESDECKISISAVSTGGRTVSSDPPSSPSDVEFELDVSLVHRGDCIKVLPGSKIPTDGLVVDGSSHADESSLTGESVPVEKRKGDVVYGGTINGQGVLYVQVTKAASENMLASISALVRQAQASKPDAQQFADRMAASFVPFILVLSTVIFFIWLGVALGGHVALPSDMSALTFALQFALSTLVVSCPCAIGLAVPTAIMVATGVAAKYGILFKGGPELEMTHRINAIVFDKTGTLTQGKPSVTQAIILPVTKRSSSHPVLPSSWAVLLSGDRAVAAQQEEKPQVPCCGTDAPPSASSSCCSAPATVTTCSTKQTSRASVCDATATQGALEQQQQSGGACSTGQMCGSPASPQCSPVDAAVPKAACAKSARDKSACDKPSVDKPACTKSACSTSSLGEATCCGSSSAPVPTSSSQSCKGRDAVLAAAAPSSLAVTTAVCGTGSSDASDDDDIYADVQPLQTESAPLSEAEFWLLAGSAELGSEHPIGAAIVAHARNFLEQHDKDNSAPLQLVLQTPTDFLSVPGSGIRCTVAERSVVVGKLSFLKELSSSESAASTAASGCSSKASCCPPAPAASSQSASSKPASCCAAPAPPSSSTLVQPTDSCCAPKGQPPATTKQPCCQTDEQRPPSNAASTKCSTAEKAKAKACSAGADTVCGTVGKACGAAAKVSENTTPASGTEIGSDLVIPDDVLSRAAELESSGHTVVYMSIDGQFAGLIGVSDAPRAESAAVVHALTGMDIDVWMMSGDQPRTAHAVARTLGIDPARVLGGLLPADKVHHVAELQKRGKIVAMVGDGVNDSPALAQAHVGIGMASGTDVAMESAHVVLVKSHLQDVLTAIDLSRATFSRIRLNFAWAMMYNVVGILLAAGTFYAAGQVAIPPAFAGLSELLSSLPVVFFSLLLSTYKPPALA